jgi:hypothetical protein
MSPDNGNYQWTEDRWSEANPSEPLTDAELDAVRSVLSFYGRANLIPRLVATIDALRDA